MTGKKAKGKGAPLGASNPEPSADECARLADLLDRDADECFAAMVTARTEREASDLESLGHKSRSLAGIYRAAARSKRQSAGVRDTRRQSGAPAWHAECAKAARAWLAVEGRNPRNVASAMAARFPYGPKAIREALRKAGVI